MFYNYLIIYLKIFSFQRSILKDDIFLGAYEDDMVLDTIVLLGTAARDPPCSTLFCKADVLISLIELLKGIYLFEQTH